MHAATPLQLSLDLTNKAELWATQLANEDKEKIDVNSKYGQNIFSTKQTSNDAVTQSVQSWYNAIRFYDFHSAKGSLKSAYFTQLVWAGSKEVGIGKAKSASGKTYIVALFDPPGNKGNYLHNVLPVTGKIYNTFNFDRFNVAQTRILILLDRLFAAVSHQLGFVLTFIDRKSIGSCIVGTWSFKPCIA